MAATSDLGATKVPTLQFGEIQASGVALVRWLDGYVCTETRSMLVLLATLLLVRFARRDCRIGFQRVEIAWNPGIQTRS